MIKIGIIIGSTRPGRKAAAVAKWAYDITRKRNDAEFELVDIADFNLPLLDEPMPAMFRPLQPSETSDDKMKGRQRTSERDFFHVWLLIGTAAVVALAVIGAIAGVNMAVCLVILMHAPVVTVVGYEMEGYRHQADALAKEGRRTEH